MIISLAKVFGEHHSLLDDLPMHIGKSIEKFEKDLDETGVLDILESFSHRREIFHFAVNRDLAAIVNPEKQVNRADVVRSVVNYMSPLSNMTVPDSRSRAVTDVISRRYPGEAYRIFLASKGMTTIDDKVINGRPVNNTHYQKLDGYEFRSVLVDAWVKENKEIGPAVKDVISWMDFRKKERDDSEIVWRMGKTDSSIEKTFVSFLALYNDDIYPLHVMSKLGQSPSIDKGRDKNLLDIEKRAGTKETRDKSINAMLYLIKNKKWENPVNFLDSITSKIRYKTISYFFENTWEETEEWARNKSIMPSEKMFANQFVSKLEKNTKIASRKNRKAVTGVMITGINRKKKFITKTLLRIDGSSGTYNPRHVYCSLLEKIVNDPGTSKKNVTRARKTIDNKKCTINR
jgi:hypothetical protein